MNTTNFEFSSLRRNIHFGEGKLNELPNLLANYNYAFVIGEARVQAQINTLKEQVGESKMLHFGEVIQHVPQHLVDKAHQTLKETPTDVLVAIGGGSSIGLAKGLALETNLPIIAVPTTYAGSEMTNIWGISTENGKTTGRAEEVLPLHVIYDPNLTATMPVGLAATSALNAHAHLMEAIYAHDTNPVTYASSIYGTKQIMKGMNLLGESKELTSEVNNLLVLATFLAGKGLAEVSMSMHHKAAHVLGGSFGLEHSHVHSVLQAYVLEYQWEALSETVQNDFKDAMNHDYPPLGLQETVIKIGAPHTLEKIGFQKEAIEKASDMMMQKPYANPRPLTKEGIIKMLRNAFEGKIEGR